MGDKKAGGSVSVMKKGIQYTRISCKIIKEISRKNSLTHLYVLRDRDKISSLVLL